PLQGYEIHMGITSFTGPHQPFARVRSAGEPWQAEGAVAAEGRILGTYLHGLFDNDTWRTRWLNALRRAAGLPEQAGGWQLQAVRTAAYDRLAAVLRTHVDIESIYRWLDLAPRR
ncbi:MAG: cobyric acid synthase CobQ, partial [Alicyclobacillus sp.]|nr:cobyric acid synthase CobQ [Alicyclobacillus sp.]